MERKKTKQEMLNELAWMGAEERSGKPKYYDLMVAECPVIQAYMANWMNSAAPLQETLIELALHLSRERKQLLDQIQRISTGQARIIKLGDEGDPK